ncbi:MULTISPECIES: ABC transporter substrate-binding protein [Gracilibacillus]|uniref:ABC transporter substrate-binding protein n=1 Tax=Gracilibacillus TaxID=74385 RepID=UPI000824C3B5|nr:MULTISPECIES: extracellular solute-binding protein [Gracilibacillus]
MKGKSKGRLYAKGMYVLLFSLCVFLVGCNSSETENGSASEDGEIVLHFWGGVPADAGPQAVVDQWNEENEDVKVEYTRFVNDDDGNLKLNTALQTGDSVDLFMSYVPNYLQDRVESEFVLDLSQFDDYDIEEKMGEEAQRWLVNDSYYAVPTKQNANFIFLNKTALDEAGLPIPEEWSWEELREYAAELTTDTRLGYSQFDPSTHTYVASALIDEGYVNANGQSNFDQVNVAEGLNIMHEMMHNDQSMMPLGEQIATGAAADQMFLNGEVAILSAFEGILRMSNDLEEYPRDFEIAFAPFPNFEGGSQIAHGLGDAISIASHTDYPEEAWEFIKWYADEGMIHQASGGRIPSSKDAPIDQAIADMVEGVEDTYDIASLERMFDQPGVIAEVLPLQVDDLLNQELERYFIDEQDLDQTIENLVDRHNQYLEE